MTTHTIYSLALVGATLLAAPAVLAQSQTRNANPSEKPAPHVVPFSAEPAASTRLATCAEGQALSQNVIGNNVGLPEGEGEVGQSFIAPCDGSLTSISVVTRPNAGSGVREATLSVYAGAGDAGTLLSQQPVQVTDEMTDDSEPDVFVLTAPASVVAGQTYTFKFDLVSGDFSLGESSSNPYADGSEFNAAFGSGGAGVFSPDASFDLAFELVFGAAELPLVTGSLGYGTCPEALPAGRAACRVDATGTFSGEQGQRYTFFLRIAETGRIAFRGEVKPQAGQTVSQSVKFRTLGADPASFTLEMVVEEGSVGAPSGAAEVLASLPFTKGVALRANEALTVFPNPATDAATLRFAVAEQTEATLVVYDALGREVARPVDGAVTGAVEASFDAAGLPAGVYVARLTTDTGTETVRLSVVR